MLRNKPKKILAGLSGVLAPDPTQELILNIPIQIVPTNVPNNP